MGSGTRAFLAAYSCISHATQPLQQIRTFPFQVHRYDREGKGLGQKIPSLNPKLNLDTHHLACYRVVMEKTTKLIVLVIYSYVGRLDVPLPIIWRRLFPFRFVALLAQVTACTSPRV